MEQSFFAAFNLEFLSKKHNIISVISAPDKEKREEEKKIIPTKLNSINSLQIEVKTPNHWKMKNLYPI